MPTSNGRWPHEVADQEKSICRNRQVFSLRCGVEDGLEGLSVVIPSWNGREVLQKFLPFVGEACRSFLGETEMVVVDDGSTDGTEEFLRSRFPHIRIVRLAVNQGFQMACNKGIEAARYSRVVLLNNDMHPQVDCFHHVLEHFNDPEVFMVKMVVRPLEQLGQPLPWSSTFPWARGLMRRGLIETHSKNLYRLEDHPKVRMAFYASGGACVLDRKKFLELEGFDALFAPAYAEDIDLSYQALKRGWKIVSDFHAVAYHHSGTTMVRAMTRPSLEMLGVRNLHLLVWKNITDPYFLIQHILWWPVRFLGYVIRGRWASVLGMLWAFGRWPQMWRARQLAQRRAVVRDRDIFAFFQNPHGL